jgi:lactoylglutathione lyase
MAKFNFVKIVVRDIATMEAFYTNAFEFAVQNRIDTPAFKEVMLAQQAGAFTLVLYQHLDGREIAVGNGWGPLGFLVKDVEAEHAAVQAAGGSQVRAPMAFGAMKVSFLSDPEGHEIELLQLPSTA